MMNIKVAAVLVALLAGASQVQAGLVIGGTRLVYDGDKKEASISVSNPDKTPYLVQSWVDTGEGGAAKAPFAATPPLFRLDNEQENVLRIVRAGGSLPSDKESLFWINIKSIPSASMDSGKNTLQIAVKTRIKLIYRPENVKGVPEDVAEKLGWQRSGNNLKISNPTPFYMNFQEVKVAGRPVTGVTYIAPGDSATFSLPAGVTGGNVTWKIISDYGAIGKEHTGAF